MKHRQATRVWAILSLLVAVCVWTLTCQTNDKQSDSRSGKPAESANGDEAKQVMNSSNSPTPPAEGDKANDQTGCVTKDMKPSIQITEIPRKGAGPDETERIAGTVTGANDEECKVVIFAHTDTWYVEPYRDSSDTPIGKDEGLAGPHVDQPCANVRDEAGCARTLGAAVARIRVHERAAGDVRLVREPTSLELDRRAIAQLGGPDPE